MANVVIPFHSGSSAISIANEDPIKIKANNQKDVNFIKIDDKYAQYILADKGDGNPEILYPKYIEEGLTCWLDSNRNTRAGYDSTSRVWEDLSGNGNDFTITGVSDETEHVWWTDTKQPNILHNTSDFNTFNTGSIDTTNNTNWYPSSGGNGTVSQTVISDPPVPGITGGYKITGNTSGNRDLRQMVLNTFVSGTTYTASWWARGSGAVLWRIWNRTDGKAQWTSQQTLSSTRWTPMSFTFTANAETASDVQDIQLGVTGTANVEFCALKLEVSNNPTGWIPHVEDADYDESLEGNPKNALGYPVHYINPRWLGTTIKISREGFDPWQMTQGWTLEFVVRPYTVENYHTLIHNQADSAYREAWMTSGNAVSIRTYNNTTLSASSAYLANKLLTITFARGAGSSATAAAYTNTHINGKNATSSSVAATNVSTTATYLFSRATTNQYTVLGQVLGFRYYNRTLSRDEIAWNAEMDKLHYDQMGGAPLDYGKFFNILDAKKANILLETNATLTKQANGTWLKARTTTSTGDTQGVIYVAIDLTPYNYINGLFLCTTDGGNDSYKVKLFAHSSAPAANTQSFTKSIDMGRATGTRWGLLDVSTLSGTYYVGLQTGTQLGTIMWLTAWA